MDQRLADLEQDNYERDMLIKSRIDDKRNRVSQVLSKIEENRAAAVRAQQERMKAIVHGFVEKQLLTAENRTKKQAERQTAVAKQLKQREDKIKHAAEVKDQEEKKRRDKINKMKKKAEDKEKALEQARNRMRLELKDRMAAHEDHVQEVLMAHAEIMEQFVGTCDRSTPTEKSS